ncbi:ureidoglycolate lyase [Psychrobacter lutiphocae]|uniref:ureidoglycolate lyase n=1 Tax=Psychrobacter lutiphocae TaxID=540500 RepID=UPI0003634450|nr:ureidoglycolate lyase [Psychrobacter lutiphocae]
MRTLIAQPLTQQNFAPFGTVIEPYAKAQQTEANCFEINEGFAVRHHALCQAQVDGGEVGMSIFMANPRQLPTLLTVMEHHPLGTQAFFSMQQQDYIVVVAPKGQPPQSPEDLSVFYAKSHQGVQYDAGVWHHPLLALSTSSPFLVVDRISGAGNNCIEVDIREWQVHVDLPAPQPIK